MRLLRVLRSAAVAKGSVLVEDCFWPDHPPMEVPVWRLLADAKLVRPAA